MINGKSHAQLTWKCIHYIWKCMHFLLKKICKCGNLFFYCGKRNTHIYVCVNRFCKIKTCLCKILTSFCEWKYLMSNFQFCNSCYCNIIEFLNIAPFSFLRRLEKKKSKYIKKSLNILNLNYLSIYFFLIFNDIILMVVPELLHFCR